MSQENNESKAPPTLLLMLLASCASFTAVFFTPALPFLADTFGVTPGQAKSTMSTYLIGYAAGLLVYAPISNRFGRKVSLYVGFLIGLLATIGCITSYYAKSYDLFVLSRFLQAIGVTCGLQVAVTIVGDCYRPPKNVKVMSLVSLSFAIGPSIGVTIGGILTQYLGWITCFYFLFLYILVLLFFTWKLVQETLLEKEIGAARLPKAIKNYIHQFKKPKITLAGICIGLSAAFFYIFATLAPFVGISILKMTPSIYGYYNIIPPIGSALGSISAHAMAKRFSVFLAAGIGIVCILACAFSMFILFSLGSLNALSLFLPFSLASFGTSLILSNMMSLAVHHASDKSLGSSSVNFLNLLMCSISVFVMPKGHVKALLLPTMFLIFSLTCLTMFSLVRKVYVKDNT